MKLLPLLRLAGLGLLGATVVFCAYRALHPPSSAAAGDGRRVLRFAHWQLEGGVREAFDLAARQYEKLHPDVRVEQLAIPERIYAQWLNTQLVGGTVADLVALEAGKGATDELIARHFTPLSEHIERPNPHNRGTDLENVPLRETILDGMQGNICYVPNLLEYYAVPLSMFTVRVHYNRTLWRELLGDTPPPADFDAFVALCERVRARARETGRDVMPIAGSRDNAAPLTDRLFASQTQRLNQRIDFARDLRPDGQAVALAYLRGEWTLDEPAVVRGFELVREAGLNFQPGYRQINRGDAGFYFVQGRAIMIATGSWDAGSFRQQAAFELGVFNLPVPTRDHPEYGPQVLGPASENDVGASLGFAIPRAAPDLALAFDFLSFLASREINAAFSARSGWLPSVVGVRLTPEIEPFRPGPAGYVDGFQFSRFGTDAPRILNSHQDKLVSVQGSVEAYLDAVRPGLANGFRSDLRRDSRNAAANLMRQDVILAGLAGLRDHGEPGLEDKISRLLEAQNRREARMAWQNHELDRTEPDR